MNNYASLSPAQARAIHLAVNAGTISTHQAPWQTINSLIRTGWLKSRLAPEPAHLGKGAANGYVIAGGRYQLTQVALRELESETSHE